MRSALQKCSATIPRLLIRSSLASLPSQSLLATRSQAIARSTATIRCLHQSIVRRQELAESQETTTEAKPETHRFTKFQQLADEGVLHPTIVRTLVNQMGLTDMTEVQSRTISTTVSGRDCIAQAKTGTGKTLAFLMPILQNIIAIDPKLAERGFGGRPGRTRADDIRAIIISPTRELAEQIAVEAKRLVQGTSVVVQAAVGGTQKSAGLRAIQREGCHILVATPGRLNDILSDEYSRIQAPDLSCMVFDEADRLLEAGFWKEIEGIMTYLPDPKKVERQTLMFSATVPKEVVSLVRDVMRPGFAFEQCVREDEEPTHERVPQHIVATKGLENQLPALIELCSREIKNMEEGGRPFKAIVYFSATNEVALANEALRRLEKPGESDSGPFSRSNHPWQQTRIFSIHSRLSQSARTNAADTFRRSKTAILLSSDVTARGLDFPDVTHVIQVGMPSNSEQYVHRIGRTARAGKEGEGWLFVDETLQLSSARKMLGKLPIKRNESLEIPALDLTQPLKVSENAGSILGMLQNSMARIDEETKATTFKSIMGAYRGTASSDRDLISKLNNLSRYGWGMPTPPGLPRALVQKLGMARIPGIVIEDRPRFDREDRFGGDRDGQPSRFGGDGFGARRGDAFGSRDSRGSFGGRDRGSDRFGSRSGGDRFGRGGGKSFGDRDSRGGSRGGYGDRDQSSF